MASNEGLELEDHGITDISFHLAARDRYKFRTDAMVIMLQPTPSSPFSFNCEGRTRAAVMSGKGKRRSARLLKLEEQKNDDDSSTVCLLDPWQIIRNSISGSSARGKRKRNDELQSQGEASCSHQPLPAANSDNSPSQSSIGQIIEYILDELEMRDRHELFAMPDDIQVADYAERVNRPGDFATLRQKNKDGMYTALEQFENDVYMVFQKAMTMNGQDTVPFREAMSLLNQAKHVFMSLKNNQMYSESELAAWRQRHLGQTHQPITPARGEGDIGVSSRRAATTLTQRTPRKKGAAEKKTKENGKNVGNAALDNQRARQRGGKEIKDTPPGKRIRKGVGGAGVAARRRLTYTDEKAGSDQAWRAMAMPALQGRHVALQDQPQEHTYRESLQRFVRHAGLKARVAAEFRSLECVARARHSPVPQYWNPGAGFIPHGYHHPTPPGVTDRALRALPPSPEDQAVAPMCKLETDELLKLFVLMCTPDVFLDRAKQMFGDDKRKEGATKGLREANAADDVRAGATAAMATDHARTDATAAKAKDTTRAAATAAKAVEHARAGATAAEEPGQKSRASEQAAAAYGPFAPPKLLPGRLGFGQFASSSSQPFKLKPSTSNAPGKKKKKL